MRVSLIVAMARNGVIGRSGGLPWKLSADLKRFKSLTMGHTIVMGRKTYESLGRVLPGRTIVVISRRSELRVPAEVRVVDSLEAAIEAVNGNEDVFFIGGGEIFELAVPRANRMYVTWVEAEVEGDAKFPAIKWHEWREISRERHSADGKNEYDTTFSVYERALTKSP